MTAIIENVVYQHAENVCALWLQRQNAVDEPHYSYADLVHLDNRIDANLEGLRVAGVHALPFIEEMITAEDEGACFAKALLTLEQGQREAFDELVQQSDGNGQMLSEIESALAWTRPDYLKDVVKTLLTSDNSAAIILGLSTCASHDKDAGSFLRTHLNNSNTDIRSTALRVCANAGLRSFAADIANMPEGQTQQERYEQARALAFLGDQRSAQEKLYSMAMGKSQYSSAAVNLFSQLSDVSVVKALLRKLDTLEGRDRDVIRGFGLIGDPVSMNWLIDRTEVPALSRLSGGSITMMTGVDLAEQDLETLDAPEGFEYDGPNDNKDDDNVALEEDEDLPWPDPTLIRSWWESSAKLPAGKYFLNGREKVHGELKQVLVEGMQRQRNAAAISLALLTPDTKFLDTRLPTNKQKLWMS